MERVSEDERARGLLKIWNDDLKPFLAEHLQGELAGIDQAAEMLDSALKRKTHLQIGFIGESQVGKSSLINALVERSALPSGGIGPLTAQATQVSYAEEDCLSVTYHDQSRLRGVRLALEGALVRRGELPSNAADVGPDTDRGGPAQDELGFDLAAVAPPPSPDGEPLNDDAARAREAAEQRFNYLMDQLWSMLREDSTNEGHGPPPVRPAGAVLVDGLRAILGERPRHPEAVAGFQPRIEELRRYVGRSEKLTNPKSMEFTHALKVRAAGWLAPLVKNLSLGLRCEVVRSLSLVDLPGIGVRADPGALVAEDFANLGGDALVVVMRNSGLTESVARLLERTGVINRLLMQAEGPPSFRVLIVVTHLDDVAKDRWREAASAARARGQRPPDPREVYAEEATKMSTQARSDIRGALLSSPSTDELTDERRARRAQRIEMLCASMDVLCVAAPDYLSLIEDFADMAWLKDREATNVPAFRRALEAVATAHAAQRSEAIVQAINDLCSLADGYLRATGQAYEEGRGAEREKWESFRSELQKSLHGLRDQMNTSHGELLAQLKTTVPADIRLLCSEAEKGALKRVATLRSSGNKLYFQSLNAALTREAVWERRGINYPVALTEKFIEPIVSDWDTRIVGGVRNAIKLMVDRDVRLVEKLCDVAEALDERVVGDAQIANQKLLMQQQAKACVAFTKETLNELTSRVSAELSTKIGQVMAAACKKARDAGDNQGSGAKKAILDAFEKGGTLATEKAREHAERLLLDHYEALRRDLQRGFLAEHHDPLADAFRRLTSDELSKATRRDTRRMAAVRAQVAHALELLAPFHDAAAPVQQAP